MTCQVHQPSMSSRLPSPSPVAARYAPQDLKPYLKPPRKTSSLSPQSTVLQCRSIASPQDRLAAWRLQVKIFVSRTQLHLHDTRAQYHYELMAGCPIYLKGDTRLAALAGRIRITLGVAAFAGGVAVRIKPLNDVLQPIAQTVGSHQRCFSSLSIHDGIVAYCSGLRPQMRQKGQAIDDWQVARKEIGPSEAIWGNSEEIRGNRSELPREAFPDALVWAIQGDACLPAHQPAHLASVLSVHPWLKIGPNERCGRGDRRALESCWCCGGRPDKKSCAVMESDQELKRLASDGAVFLTALQAFDHRIDWIKHSHRPFGKYFAFNSVQRSTVHCTQLQETKSSVKIEWQFKYGTP
ncbi:hypothetical protein R3P38DRAFT_2800007 [Favolaschia claudopus]|uniref:Uncharacterized protein n=1 Tax=Favolaschia claudopus TaxID=2862362 RepID=A0AAV9ZZ45_9AGAR